MTIHSDSMHTGVSNTDELRGKTTNNVRHLANSIVGMTHIDEFTDFCQQQRIPLPLQLEIVKLAYYNCYNLLFARQLLLYGKNLLAVLNEGEELTAPKKIPPPDITQTTPSLPSNSTADTAAISTFSLTQYASKFDNQVWEVMLDGMARLGHIQPSDIQSYIILFGALPLHGRQRVLKQPVPFYSSKKILSFWIAMMYGTLQYNLTESLVIHSKSFKKGIYSCQPLIVVPGGRGTDDNSNTRDAYWSIVQEAVYLVRNRVPQRVNNKHSFATALSPPIPTQRAAEIIALLWPLGCKSSTK